jgi:TonB family protein
MHLTLLESNRSFFQTAECALVSILAHAGIVWLALSETTRGWELPTTEREARVLFLLPPDRVDIRSRQTDKIQWGKLGSDIDDGKDLTKPADGLVPRERSYGARRRGRETGARGQLPFGPPTVFVPDTAWSVLEVDEMAERYETSAAPVYPRDLIALGVQGMVQATYIVDTTGMVDTASFEVVSSDDLRFTESVREALAHMRFRPAKRGGKTVRQLVEQKFRFKIVPPEQLGRQMS